MPEAGFCLGVSQQQKEGQGGGMLGAVTTISSSSPGSWE